MKSLRYRLEWFLLIPLISTDYHWKKNTLRGGTVEEILEDAVDVGERDDGRVSSDDDDQLGVGERGDGTKQG